MLATARPPGHLLAYTRMRFHRVSGTRVWLYYGAYKHWHEGLPIGKSKVHKLCFLHNSYTLTAFSPDNYVGTLHMLNYHGTGDT